HAAGAQFRPRPRGVDRSGDARPHARGTPFSRADARPRPALAAGDGPGPDGGQARPAKPALHGTGSADRGVAAATAPRGAGGDLPLAPLVVEPPGAPRARSEPLLPAGARLGGAGAAHRTRPAGSGGRSDDLQRRAGACAAAARRPRRRLAGCTAHEMRSATTSSPRWSAPPASPRASGSGAGSPSSG